MSRRARWTLAGLCAGLASLLGAQSAVAARVTLLGPGGRARVVDDRYLPARLVAPVPMMRSSEAVVAVAAALRGGGRTIPRRLSQLERRHAISSSKQRSYAGAWRSAMRAEDRLHGTRASELAAVLADVESISARHALTAARLPAVFLTIRRNVQWWTHGPLLSYGQRVEFAHSQLVWEYYPGQGIQLQVLGTFGKADGLYSAGPSHTAQLKALLAQMIPLAVHRGGGLAWEYYFAFDGGTPPWVSAMAQGTALEALTRAYRATGNVRYLTLAHEALGILARRPPVGVAVRAAHDTWFMQYSFAPRTDILNAFLQTLIGLYDYAKASGDPRAQALFAMGNAEAEAIVPRFDTGAWSLYQPGVEDDLSYHELVTGFLGQLCARTGADVYCLTYQHFRSYLHTPPVITQLTQRVAPRRPFGLRFRLSKISHVGIVIRSGARTLLATSAQFPYGVHAFAVPALRRGTYTVRLAATDLAGNFHRVVGSLVVAPRRKSGARS